MILTRKLPFVLILGLLGLFSPSNVKSQNLNSDNFNSQFKYGYDVNYYFLDFELQLNRYRVLGAVEIHFTALKNLNKVMLDLDNRLKVLEIVSGNEILNFTHKQSIITVMLPNSLEKGEKGVVKVFYKGQPKFAMDPPWYGGMVWGKDLNDEPLVGVTCQTDGAHVWWPVKNDLRDEPDSVKVRIKLAKPGFTCISNGKLIDKKIEEGKEIFTWKTNYPINIYNVTFYVGKFDQFSIPYSNDQGEHKIDFYVLPANLEYAKVHFEQTASMMRMMETLFGEYPWWDEGCKIIESPYRGMEHQTAIAIGTDYENDKEFFFNPLIIHELAHEWWGNSLGVGDFSDVWVHEGFATYCEALFAEAVGGKENYLKYIDRLLGKIYNIKSMNAPFRLGVRGFEGDQYYKGAIILHTLRNAVKNDQVFFDILRTFYQENKYRITSTEKFIEVVNRKTGQDFRLLFEVYLTKPKPPVLLWSYQFDEKEEKFVLKLKWNKIKEVLPIPLEISLNGKPVKLFLQPGVNSFTLQVDTKVEFNESYSYYSLIKKKKLK